MTKKRGKIRRGVEEKKLPYSKREEPRDCV
jgi:hypothetical protein